MSYLILFHVVASYTKNLLKKLYFYQIILKFLLKLSSLQIMSLLSIIFSSRFLSLFHCLHDWYFTVSFESRKCELSTLCSPVFRFTWGHLLSQIGFEISFPTSTKAAIKIFDWQSTDPAGQFVTYGQLNKIKSSS